MFCFCRCPDPSPHLLYSAYSASVLVHTVCESVHVCLCMSLSVSGDKVKESVSMSGICMHASLDMCVCVTEGGDT